MGTYEDRFFRSIIAMNVHNPTAMVRHVDDVMTVLANAFESRSNDLDASGVRSSGRKRLSPKIMAI